MKYMLLMGTTAKNWESFGTLSREEMMANFRFMNELNAELRAKKELVDAQGLTPPNAAKLVRARPGGGAPVVTDGPFPETKEFLAGFWIIDCSPERVVEIAARISTAPGKGGAPMNFDVEVRPVGQAPEL